MSHIRIKALLATASIMGSAMLASADSNVTSGMEFSWGENIGWMNWRDANGAADGVLNCGAHLEGFIWAENVGWINTGSGPLGGTMYTNTDSSDFGVNILPNGDLAGFAWGENIGWINFATGSAVPDQARYDAVAGRFRGYAWGENVGWINLDDSNHWVCAIIGNLNGDSAGVDTADLGILLGQFGTVGPDGDCNCDGVVDTADLGILLGNFLKSCQP
ncbi:MAG: hypothetical protein H6814_04005 [Phycisphaeraceae bacterium]|nr:hypothetical protein [Phycisphaeraceae bacterium]